jgi:YidC/Oxa1 family membrane protein insertase
LDNYRLLVAFLISLAIIVLYQQLLQWRFPNANQSKQGEPANSAKNPDAAGTASPMAGASPQTMGSPMAGAAPSSEMAAGASKPGAPNGPRSAPLAAMASATTTPEHLIEVDASLYKATLTTKGARLRSFLLKHYKATIAPDSPPYEIVRPGDRLPMGLVVERGDTLLDDAGVSYKTTAPASIRVMAGQDVTVTFTGETEEGLKLEKQFTFSDSTYVFAIGAHATPSDGSLAAVGLTISQPLKELGGFPCGGMLSRLCDYPELQADVTGKGVTESEQTLEKGLPPLNGAIAYAGFGDRYFLAAVLPEHPTTGTLQMDYAGDEAHARLIFPGATAVRARVYMGPKAVDLLEAASPALSKAITFGWAGFIALPFLRGLKLLYRVAPNYGVDIILLTLIVRLLTLPISIKGQRSMLRMQRLQPQVERIREKFKDDQERLNREMVDLYKRNHVNPLGGCLPMVIQLPVFFGLYETLLNAVELRQAPFVGWMADLSAPDCLPISGMPPISFLPCGGIPVLVILMAGTAFLQQWMSPRQPDPNQQKMMMFMPMAFSVLFIKFPAGLSLYYLATNLLGIAQQFVLNREFKQYTPVT